MLGKLKLEKYSRHSNCVSPEIVFPAKENEKHTHTDIQTYLNTDTYTHT